MVELWSFRILRIVYYKQPPSPNVSFIQIVNNDKTHVMGMKGDALQLLTPAKIYLEILEGRVGNDLTVHSPSS